MKLKMSNDEAWRLATVVHEIMTTTPDSVHRSVLKEFYKLLMSKVKL